ncbi:Fe-S metabolism protein SufE [Marivirga tractuosa]|uniref:Cysteine desulfuration protein SufE n=1 Tax=Marivirga tractuosa (strain ATCC 23168 / DSM 4126 / NBRC 15989 / NCIMB 1408 / VKM B-1430 / H-43) TaxID=643867 RepID=E4TTJ6_MARTH|nr:SufE family protein [Marivirga tractuosa]ADR20913.1 Cysteine desulfuration protein SufE [Marivirga tractuosa DSM 4126]BDD14636.1 Fe-S metabolism protein SufE [Marivirga tractuosa]
MADNTINAKQDEIIGQFSMLDGDMEMMIGYLIELGEKLPEMPESLKTEDNIVKGCQSKVWLTADENEGKLHFQADSNTAITKGLVSLLVSILNNGRIDDVLNADLYFVHKIGMNRFIGTQRSNGFLSMIKQIKMYALAYKTKLENEA